MFDSHVIKKKHLRPGQRNKSSTRKSARSYLKCRFAKTACESVSLKARKSGAKSCKEVLSGQKVRVQLRKTLPETGRSGMELLVWRIRSLNSTVQMDTVPCWREGNRCLKPWNLPSFKHSSRGQQSIATGFKKWLKIHSVATRGAV